MGIIEKFYAIRREKKVQDYRKKAEQRCCDICRQVKKAFLEKNAIEVWLYDDYNGHLILEKKYHDYSEVEELVLFFGYRLEEALNEEFDSNLFKVEWLPNSEILKISRAT